MASNSSKNKAHGAAAAARANRSRTPASEAPMYLLRSSGPLTVTNLSAKEIRHRHCGHASLPQWPWLSYPRLLWQYRLVQDYDFALKEQIADSGGASFSRVCMLRLIAANENVSTFTVANPDTTQHVPHLSLNLTSACNSPQHVPHLYTSACTSPHFPSCHQF